MTMSIAKKEVLATRHFQLVAMIKLACIARTRGE